MTACRYGINYSPDSVRIPLTAFFSKEMNHTVLRLAQSLMNKFDTEINQEIERICGAYSNPYFRIEVPALFSYIIKSCTDSDADRTQLIDTAIRLREDDNLKNLREWIKELSMTESRLKYSERLELFKRGAESRNKSVLNRLKGTVPLFVSGFSVAFGNLLSALSFLKEGVTYAIDILPNYYKARKLVFLREMRKSLDEVMSVSRQLNQIFGSSLSSPGIEFYKRIAAYQDDYLPKLFDVAK